MKSRITRLAGWCSIAALGAVAGCATADSSQPLGSTLDRPTFDEFVASRYQEPASGLYIVDWDVPVATREGLRPYYDALYGGEALTVNTVEGADTVWTATEKSQLTYCVSDAFAEHKAAVVQAMADATGAWMASADVGFRHDASLDASCSATTAGVLFDVNPVDGEAYVARAFFPNSPRDQRNVLIDTQAFTIPEGSVFTLLGVLEHELGHSLGFRHEHVRADIFNIPFENWLNCVLEGFVDQNYRPVTDYDSASVMHYPQCGGTGDLHITALDVAGAQSIYGAPHT